MYTYLKTNNVPDLQDRRNNTDEKDLSRNTDKMG
jgi:hypothetical protein